jgi:hypothetical protein
MLSGEIGFIDTPRQRNDRPVGVTWCADNGCFSSKKWDSRHWWEFLENNVHDIDTCLFATAPDVVGDAGPSLERSAPWLPWLRMLGYPAALVAQNGMDTVGELPWDEFDVLFLGGSPECVCGFVCPIELLDKLKQCCACDRDLYEWKEGEVAAALTAEALQRGKTVHMGRVNSQRRYDYAKSIGCSSVDGTFLRFGPDANLVRLLRWIRGV